MDSFELSHSPFQLTLELTSTSLESKNHVHKYASSVDHLERSKPLTLIEICSFSLKGLGETDQVTLD